MPAIRWATKDDSNEISRLLAESWKTVYRGMIADAYLDALTDSHWVSLLSAGLADRRVAAAVMAEGIALTGVSILRVPERDGQAHLISLYLRPDKIGQGYGHSLYTWVEDALRQKGMASCTLDVLYKNERAIRFYKDHGFAETGRVVLAKLGEKHYPCEVFEKVF